MTVHKVVELEPCPESVKQAGAALLKARSYYAEGANVVAEAYAAVHATMSDMKALGAFEMEYAEAFSLLSEASNAQFKIAMAHNSLRKWLVDHGVAQPTDGEITAILGVVTRGPGGR